MSARARLVALLCVGVLAVCLERPGALGALVVLASAALLTVPAARHWWRVALLGAGAVIWSTVLSQGLFYADWPATPLVALGPLVVTREGVSHGAVQSLRLVAVSFGGLALVAGTSSDRLLVALVRLRVPWALAFLAVTSLRLVPVVGQEWLVVRQARLDRGPRPSGAYGWLTTELALLRPIVARTLRRSRSLAVSLDARGFDPLAARTLQPDHSGVLGRSAVVGLALLTALVVAMRVLEGLYLAGLVYVPELRWLYGIARTWL